MFNNIGLPEILIILLIVLILFGAKRIPEVAGSLGKGINEFKRNMTEAQRAMVAELVQGPISATFVSGAEKRTLKRLREKGYVRMGLSKYAEITPAGPRPPRKGKAMSDVVGAAIFILCLLSIGSLVMS